MIHTAPTRSNDLVEALLTADPTLPPALRTFDAVAGAPDPEPDFLEWSARLRDARDAARLTYYFDVARRGAAVARAAAERFSSLAGALGAMVPRAFADAVGASVPDRPEILQLVLGIDAGPVSPSRVKLYAVLRDAAPDLVKMLVELAGDPDGAPLREADKVYIVGFDFGAGGLLDAKLYYRLDQGRLDRVVGGLATVRDLLEGTREVVLQRCTRSDRSQIYLHATNESVVQRYLDERRGDATVARLLERQTAASGRMAPRCLQPWIISFELADHRLSLDAGTVYFHCVRPDAS